MLRFLPLLAGVARSLCFKKTWVFKTINSLRFNASGKRETTLTSADLRAGSIVRTCFIQPFHRLGMSAEQEPTSDAIDDA